MPKEKPESGKPRLLAFFVYVKIKEFQKSDFS